MVEAAAFGLDVHETKTKILRNGYGRGTKMKQVIIEGRKFEVLPSEASSTYLGRLFSFESTHDAELQHSIGKGWAKFAIFRSELTDKHYEMAQRMKLFKAGVQLSFLYGCVSWTLTREREHKIRTTHTERWERTG